MADVVHMPRARKRFGQNFLEPAWVDKGAWKMELGPLTYYFAVGKAAFGAATAAAPGEKSPGSGRVLDWWFDESAGALYTLVVEAR